MDEVRNKLTQQEKALLNALYENRDLFRALQTALSHRQLNNCQFSATQAADFGQVMKYRGQIEEDNWIISFIVRNHKDIEAAKKAKTSTTSQ